MTWHFIGYTGWRFRKVEWPQEVDGLISIVYLVLAESSIL
jgi:hypothetical protein